MVHHLCGCTQSVHDTLQAPDNSVAEHAPSVFTASNSRWVPSSTHTCKGLQHQQHRGVLEQQPHTDKQHKSRPSLVCAVLVCPALPAQNAVTFQAQGAAARLLTGSNSKTLVSWQDTCISGMFAGRVRPVGGAPRVQQAHALLKLHDFRQCTLSRQSDSLSGEQPLLLWQSTVACCRLPGHHLPSLRKRSCKPAADLVWNQQPGATAVLW